MATSYLAELLKLADRTIELDQLEDNIKGTSDWKAAKAEYEGCKEQFARLGDQYIDGLLASDEGRAGAVTDVEAQIAEFREQGDPSWHPALDYLETHFLPKLRKEAGRSPRMRKAIKASPWVLAAVIAAVYFAVRLLSGTPVDAPLETREGIEQRAAAAVKALRYDDLMHTHVRKGGFLKGIMLWPIEPTEQEVQGAAEFVGLVIEGQRYTQGCGSVTGYDDKLSKPQIKMIKEVAGYVRDEATTWDEPPVKTVLSGLKHASAC